MNGRHSGAGPGNAERDAGLDWVYRETAREMPPAHLDAAILAAARRELGAGPRPMSARLRRWRMPVSIAAVIVLSASLAVLVTEEGGEPPVHTPAVSPPAAGPADPMRQPAPVESAPSRPARRDEAGAIAPAELGTRADGGPRALLRSAPDTPRAAEGRAAVEERAGHDATLAIQRDKPVGATPEAPRAGPMARSMQAERAPSGERLPVWHGLEQEPPQKWLDRAVELKRLGRTAEAGELLAEFKRRFPDHRLPVELE